MAVESVGGDKGVMLPIAARSRSFTICISYRACLHDIQQVSRGIGEGLSETRVYVLIKPVSDRPPSCSSRLAHTGQKGLCSV